jgi:hypothetical protein
LLNFHVYAIYLAVEVPDISVTKDHAQQGRRYGESNIVTGLFAFHSPKHIYHIGLRNAARVGPGMSGAGGD